MADSEYRHPYRRRVRHRRRRYRPTPGRLRSGFSAFERARRAQLVGGWAALVRTPSGGIHTYYPATPDRSQQSWQAPRVHIDFRGDGGYIIAPPSTIRTKVGQAGYSVIATGTRAASSIDAERLHAFLDPVPAPSNSPQRQQRIDMSGLASWVAAREEGQRNGALFWAACRATEHGLTTEEIHAILGPAAQHAGLPAREIAATLRSAGRTTTARGQRPRAAWEQHPARSARSDMGRPLL
jgi:hypothetical protein